MNGASSKEQFIKTCVKQLLTKVIEDVELDAVISESLDDIVLTYVLGVLEETDDAVDSEEFVSIMEAYIPCFASLESDDVKQWIDETQIQLRRENFDQPPIICEQQAEAVKPKRGRRRTTSRSLSETDKSNAISAAPSNSWSDTAVVNLHRPHSVSDSSGSQQWPTLCEDSAATAVAQQEQSNDMMSRSSSRTASECVSETASEHSEQIELLEEMFPNLSLSVIESCLQRTKYDVESAVVSLLQESTEPATVCIRKSSTSHDNVTSTAPRSTCNQQKKSQRKAKRKGGKERRSRSTSIGCDADESVDDDSSESLAAGELKELIIQKYSFIPEDVENKTYTPKLQTSDEKKMIRYRNGQVVSTRGERFSEIKEPMTEEMKKTYINLKPAKQYRFH